MSRTVYPSGVICIQSTYLLTYYTHSFYNRFLYLLITTLDRKGEWTAIVNGTLGTWEDSAGRPIARQVVSTGRPSSVKDTTWDSSLVSGHHTDRLCEGQRTQLILQTG